MDLRDVQTINLFKEIYKPDDSSLSFMLPILIFFTTGIIILSYKNRNKCIKG